MSISSLVRCSNALWSALTILSHKTVMSHKTSKEMLEVWCRRKHFKLWSTCFGVVCDRFNKSHLSEQWADVDECTSNCPSSRINISSGWSVRRRRRHSTPLDFSCDWDALTNTLLGAPARPFDIAYLLSVITTAIDIWNENNDRKKNRARSVSRVAPLR